METSELMIDINPKSIGLIIKVILIVIYGCDFALLLTWKLIDINRSKKFVKLSEKEVDRLEGATFEQYLRAVFKYSGYTVRHTGGTGDFGADLILYKEGKKTVVQAKQSKAKVGVKAVQQVMGAMNYYNCKSALVVTNNSYTAAAKKLASSSKGVELWDGKRLKGEVDMIKRRNRNLEC